jgi:dolichol-phosphate mannosyltransferase
VSSNPLDAPARTPSAVRPGEFALAIAAASLVLRLAFAGTTDLLPEEAYYWNYAQHLDFGYVDHPPMIAWMIALSTGLFGDSEFAVRLPAILCGLATAYFMYRWTETLFGTSSARFVLMLLAIFPFYFSTGFFMLPDTPLTAAWAGCLYFLSQALLAENRRAWLGVGICIGLGMLSKYSIALLGPAALLFAALDPRARPWLWRREPYLAILVAIVLFSPVVVWNATHDWISFLYQGTERWSTDIDFSLHILILSALLLITPFGLIGVTLTWLPRRMSGLTQSNNVTSGDRLWLFTLIFSLVPLSVFVLHSIQDNPKIQWTGPLWLAALPVLASAIDPQRADMLRRFRGFFSQKLWKPVAGVMLLLLGGLLYAMTVGPALLPAFDKMGLPVAWEEMMQTVEEIENELELETGARPLVVGLSNYFISAEHAFYDPKGQGVEETGGRGLLGYNGWMWDHWQKPRDYAGRDFVLVTFEPEYLDRARFEERFARISDAKVVPIMKSGRIAARFSYRIGYGYQPPP